MTFVSTLFFRLPKPECPSCGHELIFTFYPSESERAATAGCDRCHQAYIFFDGKLLERNSA